MNKALCLITQITQCAKKMEKTVFNIGLCVCLLLDLKEMADDRFFSLTLQ